MSLVLIDKDKNIVDLDGAMINQAKLFQPHHVKPSVICIHKFLHEISV